MNNLMAGMMSSSMQMPAQGMMSSSMQMPTPVASMPAANPLIPAAWANRMPAKSQAPVPSHQQQPAEPPAQPAKPPQQLQDDMVKMSEQGRKTVVSLLHDMRQMLEDCKSVREAHLVNIRESERVDGIKDLQQRMLSEGTAPAQAVEAVEDVAVYDSQPASQELSQPEAEAPEVSKLQQVAMHMEQVAQPEEANQPVVEYLPVELPDVARYHISGFNDVRLNSIYYVETQDHHMVGGRPTYWAHHQGEDFFMYFDRTNDRWTISPKLEFADGEHIEDLFQAAKDGGSLGLAFCMNRGEDLWQEFRPDMNSWSIVQLFVGCDKGSGQFQYNGAPPPQQATPMALAAPATPAPMGGGMAAPSTPLPIAAATAQFASAPATPAPSFGQPQSFAAPGTPVGAGQQLHPALLDYADFSPQPQVDLKTLMKPELSRKREVVLKRDTDLHEPTVMVDYRSRSSSSAGPVNDWGKGKGKGIETKLDVIPDAAEVKRQQAKEKEEAEAKMKEEAESKIKEEEALEQEKTSPAKKRRTSKGKEAKEKAEPKAKAKGRAKKEKAEQGDEEKAEPKAKAKGRAKKEKAEQRDEENAEPKAKAKRSRRKKVVDELIEDENE